LFTIVGLSYEEVLSINTKSLGVEFIEGVLGIDEGTYTALLLALCNSV
jgi:hypothetical protein